MAINLDAFNYLTPTEEQQVVIDRLRMAVKAYAEALDRELPEGSDKDYVMRRLRDVAIWVNIALTRSPDGTPLVRK